MKFIRDNKFSFLLLLVLIGISVFYYGKLPAQLPTKFDMDGNPTKFASRDFVVMLAPTLYLLVMLLTTGLVAIAPQKYSMPQSRKTLGRIIFGLGFLFLGLHLGTLMSPTGNENFIYFFTLGMGFFMVVLGDALGKTERNFHVGFRFPWTLASDTNWRATHRFGGRLMVAGGMLVLFLQLTNLMVDLLVPIATLVAVAVVAGIYSFVYFRRKEHGAAEEAL